MKDTFELSQQEPIFQQAFDRGTALQGVFFFHGDVAQSRLEATQHPDVQQAGDSGRSINLPANPETRAAFIRKFVADNNKKVATGLGFSLLFLPMAAHAQAAGEFVNAAGIEGVRSATVLADGSARLVLDSGQSVIVPAESVNVLASGEVTIAQTAATTVAEAAAGGAGVLAGGAAGGAGAAVLGLAALGGAGGGAAAIGVAVVGASGFVVDGYVAGATVFRDVNDNGVFDTGEPNVLTDANGEFTGLLIDPTNPSAKILTQGGIDIATGQPFVGTMSAPADATVVTPITTLVQALVDSSAGSGTPLTSAQAAAQIANALGLSGATDVLTTDPVKTAEEGDLTALKAATQVANVINLAAAGGTGSSADSSSSASQALATSLVNAAGTPGAANPLTDQTELQNVLTGAVGAGKAADIAGAASSANGIIDGAANDESGLQSIEQVLTVVQDNLVNDAQAGNNIGSTDVAAEAAKVVPLRPTLDRLPASINAADKTGGLDVTGTGRPGTIVTVDFDGATKSATVATDGSWSVTFAAADFPADPSSGTATISATAVVSGSTLASPAANWTLVLDSTPPGTPAIDAVQGDDFVNGTEALGGFDVTGTSEAGASISVQIGAATRVVTADGTGAWTAHFTAAEVPADGASSVTASATDAAGNAGAGSANRTFTVDTVGPAAPTISAVATDDIINATEKAAGVVVSGTAGAGETVVVDLGTTSKTVTADGTGAWTTTFAAADIPVDGLNSITAVAQDAAGNASTAATRAIEINTAPPGAPAFNAVATDDVVNATEAAAGLTLTGTVAVGSSVDVTLNGVTRAAAVDGSGNWTVAYTAGEVPADGAATVSATATDGSGNTATASRGITVDTTSATPTISTIATDDRVDATEASSGLVVSGTADGGSAVTVQLGKASVNTTAASDGNWTAHFTAGALPASGSSNVSAFATDPAGNTSALATRSVAFDTSAPGAPVISAVSTDDAINYLESVAGITVSGTAEAGATVEIILGQVTKTATATGGNWSVTFASKELPPDGVLSVTAQATDDFGNQGSAATRSLTFDTRGPGVPVISDVSGDNLVNATEKAAGIVAAGTSDPGVSVVVTIGATSKTVTSDGTGAWSATFASGELPGDGATEVTARATDASGNASPTAAKAFTVDTAATTPTIAAIATDDVVNGAEKTAGVDVSGTAEAGASVDVQIGAVTKTVTADGSGAWTASFATGDLPADGAASVSATATDPAGNTSSAATRAFTVDTTPPAAPTIGAIASDDVVNAAEKTAGITITGTSEAGASVDVTIGTKTNTVTADGTGAWSATFAAADIPADGAASVSATATDTAGNTGTAATKAFTVDTTPPAVPTIDTVAGDDIVNATESSAGVTVTGTADAGASVTVALGTATRTVTADGTGAWSASFASGDTPPDGTATVTAHATDAAGNASADATHAITVEARPPAAPTITAIATDDVVNAAEKAAGVNVTGTTEAGASVDVTIGATTHTVTADGTGAWSATFATAEIPTDGPASVSATATDTAGNTGTAATKAFTVDTTPPAAPTIAAVTSDNVVNGAEKTAGVAVSGSAEAGASVDVTIGTKTHTVTADGTTGAWSATFATSDLPTDGAASVSATATDAAGNTGTAATKAFAVDTTPPAAPTISTVATDNVINAAERTTGVTISGSADANSSVDVTLGSKTHTVSADGTGAWSATFTTADIPDSGAGLLSTSVSATSTDAAGNTSAPGTRSLTIDTAPPAVPTIDTIAGDDVVNATEGGTGITVSGTAEAGVTVTVGIGVATKTVSADQSSGVWTATFAPSDTPADGAASVTASASDANGNSSANATRNFTVDTTGPTATISAVTGDDLVNGAELAAGISIAGTTEANASVSVTLNGVTNSATADGTGAFSVGFAASDLPGDGTYTVSATATDISGNAGSAATRSITVDSTATQTPAVNAIATDDVVNAAEKAAGLAVAGTAEANASVAVTLGTTIKTVTADASGDWSASFTAAQVPGDGAASISAVATGASGVPSSAGTRAFTVDTTPPAAPTIAAVTSDNLVNGAEKTAGVAVSGSAEAGASVDVTIGGTTNTVTANGTGAWSATFATADIPADGAASVSATATDAAGNTGTAATKPFTVDTTPPATPTINAIETDDIVNAAEKATSVTVTGTADSGTGLAITMGSTTHNTVTYANGTWEITFAIAEVPSDGPASVSVVSTDAAGNASSATRNFTIDTTPPAAPTIAAIATDDVVNAAEKTAGVAISGTAEANSSVDVTIGATTHTVSADGTGAWSATFTAAEIPADGAASVSATATDTAGNTGTAATKAFTVDTTPPAAPTINAITTDDVVNGPESEADVVISGSAGAGETVSVTFGSTVHSVTADGSGAWSATFTPAEIPTDGAYTVSATATDAAGNTSTAGTRAVTVDAFMNIEFFVPLEQSDVGTLWNGTVFNPNATIVGTPNATGFSVEQVNPTGLPAGTYHATAIGQNLTYDVNGPTGGTLTAIEISLNGVLQYRQSGVSLDIVALGAAIDAINTSGDRTAFDALYANYRYNRTGSSGDDGILNGIPGSAHGDVFNMGDGNDGGLSNGGNDVFNGGNGDDWFYAEAGNQTMNGGAGNDWFHGGAGDDTYDGGSGDDMMSYQNASSAVNIDLTKSTQSDGDGGTDTLINVESVRGSAFNDTLTGDANDNRLQGMQGNDTLDGAGGSDWVSYERDARSGGTNGVQVDLAAGQAVDGFGATDTLVNIENVAGTQYDDTIAGDGGNNQLRGMDGNDTLGGRGGNDAYEGGAGADTFVYSSGADLILDFTPGTDTLNLFGLGLTTAQLQTAFGAAVATSSPNGSANAAIVDFGSGNTLTFDGLTAAQVQALPAGGHGISADTTISAVETDDRVTGSEKEDGVTITGTAIAGNSVTVEFGAGGTSKVVTADEIGQWSADFTRTEVPADANVTVTATASSGGSATRTVLVDAIADVTHHVALEPNDTWNLQAGSILNTTSANLVAASPTGWSVEAVNPSGLPAGTYRGDITGVNLTYDGATGLPSGGTVTGYTLSLDGVAQTTVSGTQIPGTEVASMFLQIAASGGTDFTAWNNLFASYALNVTGSTGNDGINNGINGTANTDTFNMGDGNDGVNSNGGDDVFNGGNGDDWFYAEAGNQTMNGGAGNDWFHGGAGDDYYDGGADNDMVSYQNASSAVNIDLTRSTQSDGDGGTDTLVNVESVRGSAFNDTLTGDANDNQFQGMQGNDKIDGAGGNDTIRYDRDARSGGTNGVSVDLGGGWATDGWGNLDTLSNIENAFGTQNDDQLIGSSSNNVLFGADGNDTLNGKSGDDSSWGGNGRDTFVYESGNDIILDFTSGTDILELRSLGLTTDQILTVFSGAVDIVPPTGAAQAAQVSFSAGNSLTFVGLTAAQVQALPKGANGILTTNIVMHTNDPFELLQRATILDPTGTIDGAASSATLLRINVASSSLFNGQSTALDVIGTGFDAAAAAAGNPPGGTVTGFKMYVNGTLRAEVSGLNMATNDLGQALSDFHATPPNTATIDALFQPYRINWTGSSGDDFVPFPNTFNDQVRTPYGDVFSGGGATNWDGMLGGDGNDTFNAQSGAGHGDWAVGGAGHDIFFGDAGPNWFDGRSGNDVFEGGAGADEASYSQATGSVIADLTTGIVVDGQGGVDRLTSVEWLRGGAHDDTFKGDAADNVFRGLDGADTMDGGAGNDTVKYDRDGRQFGGHGQVSVDLAAGTATDGFGKTDTLTNIENAMGSYTDDTLRGEGGANRLDGDSGDDVLGGRGGNDTYRGGAGYDVFEITSGAETIEDFKIGVDRLDLTGMGLTNAQITTAFAGATAVAGGALVDFGGGNSITFNGLTATQAQGIDPFAGPIQHGVAVTSNQGGFIVGDEFAKSMFDTNATFTYDANGITITGSGGESTRLDISNFRYYEEINQAYTYHAIRDGVVDTMTVKDASGAAIFTFQGGELDAWETVNAITQDRTVLAGGGTATTNTDTLFSQFSVNWTGSAGNDTIGGFDNADVLKGLAGDDKFETRGGNDIIEGGPGQDVIVLGEITGFDPTTGFPTFTSVNDGSNTIRINLGDLGPGISGNDWDAIAGFDTGPLSAGGDVLQLMLPSASASPISLGITALTVTDLQGATLESEINTQLAGLPAGSLTDDTVELLLVGDSNALNPTTVALTVDVSGASPVVTPVAVFDQVTDTAALSDGTHIILTNPVV